ncbi:MAG: hypothetical protein ACREXT_15160, partial [Gammaproteobacteria bacterium]
MSRKRARTWTTRKHAPPLLTCIAPDDVLLYRVVEQLGGSIDYAKQSRCKRVNADTQNQQSCRFGVGVTRNRRVRPHRPFHQQHKREDP